MERTFTRNGKEVTFVKKQEAQPGLVYIGINRELKDESEVKD
jgi:hypothetical protein